MNIGEQILIWFLVLPFGTLLLVIVEMVGEKTAQKRRERERAEIERVLNENRRALLAQIAKPSSKPVVRGYDSGDLFRQDALIRMRKLEAEIAAGVKPST
jgi:hypothetical protein